MRTFKKITFILLSLILTLVISLFILATVYEEDVKQYAIKEINKQLIAKVDVREINFTILRHFPYATLEFKNTTIHNPTNFTSGKQLLHAENVMLQFNIIDIIKKNYTIRKIKIDQSKLYIIVNRNGNSNLEIFKKGDGKASPFKLSSVTSQNLYLEIDNQLKRSKLFATISNASFKGNFFESNYSMALTSEGTINKYQVDNRILIRNRKAKTSFELDVNSNLYSITKGQCILDELELEASGTVSVLSDTIYKTNLQLEGKNFGIEEVTSFFPDNLRERLKDYENDGALYFKALITGIISKENNPIINASFGINNGTFTYKPTGMELKRINLKGVYKSGSSNDKSILNLSDIYAELGKGNIKGNFSMKGFEHPVLNINTTAKLDLNDLLNFIKTDKLEAVTGLIKINARYAGKVNNVNQFTFNDFNNANVTGELGLSNTNISLKNNPFPISALNASINFAGNDVRVDELECKYGKTDLNLEGYLKNFLAYIFLDDQKLEVDGSFQSDLLDLNEILTNKSENHSKEEPYIIKFSDKYKFNLTCNAKKIIFRKFTATNVKALIQYQNRELKTEDVSLSSLGGRLNLNAFISATSSQNFNVSCNGAALNININELFTATENFGQEVLQDKNITGVASTEFVINGVWDSTLTCNTNLLSIRSHLQLDKGELKNFEPLYHLSKFISLEELKSIRFEKLENTIEIKNRIISIPAMDIASNALNLTFAGTHTFDNIVDYHFKLLLNELLSKKLVKQKKQNEEFGVIEDDGLGRTTLFIGMKGPVASPSIYYDTKGLKIQTKESIASEKQNIKSILKDELGLFKKDSTIKSTSKKKEKELGVDWGEENKASTERKKEVENPKEKRKVNKLLKQKEEEETSGENSDDFN